MAAHPSEKRWYQRPLQTTIIGVLLAAALTLVVTRLTKENPPPTGPSSDNATMVIVEAPRFKGDVTFEVSGTGWYADTAVTIKYPTPLKDLLSGRYYKEVRAPVRNGEFSLGGNVYGMVLLEPGQYRMFARGEQSGHEASDQFLYVGGPETTTTVSDAIVP